MTRVEKQQKKKKKKKTSQIMDMQSGLHVCYPGMVSKIFLFFMAMLYVVNSKDTD